MFDFGATVELSNGFHCLLHISQLAKERIDSIHEVLREGQELEVKCIKCDPNGDIMLSRKALL